MMWNTHLKKRHLHCILLPLVVFIFSCGSEPSKVLGASENTALCTGSYHILQRGLINGNTGIKLNNKCTSINGNLLIGPEATNDDLEIINELEYITGNLTIDQTSKVTHLDHLQSLTRIGGTLQISYTENLENLNGLNHLQEIGEVYILINQIKELNTFNQLTEIKKDITILANIGLEKISGFDQLERVGGNIFIHEYHTLHTLSGFSKLARVGSRIEIDGTKLKTIAGFEQLTETTGLKIVGNDSLTQIPNFTQLAIVWDRLNLSGFTQMESLGAFASLSELGSLYIQDNSNLTTLPKFDNIQSTSGDIIIADNASLTSIANLKALQYVGGSLEIRGNHRLQSLHGLNNILSVEQNLILQNNLTSIGPLEQLLSIGGILLIQEPLLESLDGLSQLNSAHTLSIISNPDIVEQAVETTQHVEANSKLFSDSSFEKPYGRLCDKYPSETVTTVAELSTCGILLGSASVKNLDTHWNLPNEGFLQEIRGSLSINNNYYVSELPTFKNLRLVSGSISITNNPKLKSIRGFNELQSLHGNLTISRNDQLENIVGFDALNRTGSFVTDLGLASVVTNKSGDISIEDNGNLSSIRAFPQLHFMKGTLTIQNNESLSHLIGFDNLSYAKTLNLSKNNLTSLNNFKNLIELDTPPTIVEYGIFNTEEWFKRASE